MKEQQKKQRQQGGFTLVEIMVVVVIIGMLAALVGQNVLSQQGEAQIDTAKADLSSIDTAVQLYAMRKGRIPEMEELITPDDNGQAFLPNYEEEPNDPWGNPYIIRGLDGRLNYEVISYGPDGDEDTEDDLSSKKKARR